MTNQKEIYKCELCGNIVEVLHAGAGELVCCGQAMSLMGSKSVDDGKEKHLPFIDSSMVKIGEVTHPMTEEHYIEWIEIVYENKSVKKFLKPEEEAIFELDDVDKIEEIRSYCNVHGLWRLGLK